MVNSIMIPEIREVNVFLLEHIYSKGEHYTYR